MPMGREVVPIKGMNWLPWSEVVPIKGMNWLPWSIEFHRERKAEVGLER